MSPPLRHFDRDSHVALPHAHAMALLRYCLTIGCKRLVPSGRCDEHGGATGGWKGLSPRRIRGRALQALRADLFRREPLCRVCQAEGRDTTATIRDHIVPLTEGGTEDATNIQPLCQSCSDRKTATESQRGRARAW